MAIWHTDDLSRFEAGDYILYSLGAEHFQSFGDFTNSLFLVRPPLFSLIIYALNMDNNAVLLFNSVIGSLIAPLSCILALQFGFSSRYALLAGIIVAVDPSSIVFSAFLGPEPIANFLLLVSIILLLKSMTSLNKNYSLLWSITAATALVLSAFTRPATYLLWVILAFWFVLIDRKKWLSIAAFALFSLLGISVWLIHNATVFDNPTFSTISPYTMLYYRAASIERIAVGQTSENMDDIYTKINQRVEQHLGHDISTVDAGTRNGYFAASPEVADALQAVSLEIFLKYPLIYIATIPVGFARMYGLLPFASNLLPHFSNNWLSIGIQIAWNGIFLLGSILGLWFAYRRKHWVLLGGVFTIGVYYTVGTLLVKSSGLNTRERTMLTPFMAVAFVYAVQFLWEKWQERRKI